jgi:hypothetical protein
MKEAHISGLPFIHCALSVAYGNTGSPSPAPPSAWQVEHRNKSGGQRLKNLCQSETKRFYVFSNEHHRCADDVTGTAAVVDVDDGGVTTRSPFATSRNHPSLDTKVSVICVQLCSRTPRMTSCV